jgi:hypothetical protein
MLVNQYRKVIASKMDNSVGDAGRVVKQFLLDLKRDKFWARVKTAWDILRGI